MHPLKENRHADHLSLLFNMCQTNGQANCFSPQEVFQHHDMSLHKIDAASLHTPGRSKKLTSAPHTTISCKLPLTHVVNSKSLSGEHLHGTGVWRASQFTDHPNPLNTSCRFPGDKGSSKDWPNLKTFTITSLTVGTKSTITDINSQGTHSTRKCHLHYPI